MKGISMGRVWIKVLAVALIAKLAVVTAMLCHLDTDPPILENVASAAASGQSDNAKTLTEHDESACHPELLRMLRIKMAKLQDREKALDDKEENLRLLERDIDEKIKQLKDLQRKLEGPVKKKRFEEEARLQHLAGVYSSMDPVRAAALLDKMDEDTVTRLFSIMKSKKVAKILANMSPEKAARISQRLYGGGDDAN
ncbi:MAG: hypothetical protein GXO58_04355 [Thermodesulfobacteria bacterium]|nr:hypothetical protein [Thermodesulfobacteriota bacterium]